MGMSLVAMKQPYLLQVMYDEKPLNPRTNYDNFGRMVCWHSRYNLGDKYGNCSTEGVKKLKALLKSKVETYDYYLQGNATALGFIRMARKSRVDGI